MSNPALSEDVTGAHGSNRAKGTPPAWAIGLAGVAIVLAGWAAYSNSLGGTFTFDDADSILKNPTLRQSWGEALSPPVGTTTVSGRPLVNLSVALNYHLGGFNVWGYHAVNLLIQLLAGLTLFGLVRRTLERPVLRDRYGAVALPLAFLIALLWTVHPLQTGSVTYVIQRAESLMGLFYLLTLYCFVRGVESSRTMAWAALSVLACALGMITKETMVTAPLVVLLYDRTFVAGTFAAAWRRRWKFYAALACAWLPLAWLVVTVSWPGNASLPNPSLDGLSPAMKSYVYALRQCEAIVHYVSLSFWPHPLVFNYGEGMVTNPLDVAPQIVLLGLLVGGVLYALWRRPVWGFLGAWFFVILAPTSSVMPLHGESMAERHMYLSLAAPLVFLVLGLHALLGRSAHAAGLALAMALGGLTFERNRDYRTEISIWADTLQDRPDDPSSQVNVGMVLDTSNRLTEALARYAMALRLRPIDPVAENNFGADLNSLGEPALALEHLRKGIPLRSTWDLPYYNLGNSYSLLGQPDQARDAYLAALRIFPDFAAVHFNLGGVYMLSFGQLDLAIAEYKKALQADPTLVLAQAGLGDAYMRANQPAEAIPHLVEALRLKPNFGEVHRALGDALSAVGRVHEAIPEYEAAARLLPGDAATRNNLGLALIQLKQFDEAARQFEEALRLDPRYPEAQNNLAKVRVAAGPGH